MIAAIAAALVVALAAPAPRDRPAEERPRSLAELNAARKRAGLLPRKAPPRPSAVSRHGKRLVRAVASGPTLLGEPGSLAAAGRPGRAPAPAGGAAEAPRRLNLSVHGVTTDVTLSMRFDR